MSFFRPEIEAMAGYVPGEQPQEDGIIKLNTNENPYPPSPAVAAAIQETVGRLKKYPDPMAETFRRRAGELLDVDPSWILCGNGSDDILTIITRAWWDRDNCCGCRIPVTCFTKRWLNYRAPGTKRCIFNADWSLPARFASPEGNPRLVFLANPNSPSGTMVAPERVLEIGRKSALSAFCRRGLCRFRRNQLS